MKQLLLLPALLLVLTASSFAQRGYIGETEKWRAEHQKEQITEDGWFTVAGLFWLKEGLNSVGRGEKYDVSLTENFKGDKFGEIDLTNGKATLRVEPGIVATMGGSPVSTIELVSDEKGKPTKIDVGSQTLYVIMREGKYGVRLKDKDSPERKHFTGLKWYPIEPSIKVTATLAAYDKPRDIMVPNILGGSFKYQSPGILTFKLKGKAYSLTPVIEEDHLFIIFKDLTSKTASYGAGRFLYADMPKNGKVILDFNRAENPPCAYTKFATCPLPPLQNRLAIAIKAGEKRYHH